MNAAWGGISEETEITICVDSSHKTAENLIARKAFTVSMATAGYISACDYVGIVSGNKVPDKFERSRFHAVKSEFVNAPIIEEFPITMECELAEVINTENMFAIVGKIVNVCVNAELLGDDGKVDASRIHALMFDQFHFDYYEAGAKVGKAFSEGKKLLQE